ncbi:Vacuolar amino acid transporter 1 [Morella rubra]|uniref:Vacuolar amino acid transporter 1 n=1 Tax=Morella rubra TaxID=262757 RepID=A0A6A1WDA8_9ROSI|nr:Vacuolar amino acid transporter 1 [Morella rubra]
MKLDYDDFARDRGDEFQTDDEENDAERVCVHEYDTESEVTSSPRRPSDSNMDPNNPTWPQTYRKSIDMFSGLTPPSISILRGESLTGISSFISTAYNRPETSEHVSSASKPLLSETSLDKEVLSSTLPVKFSASTHSKFSISESLPPQKQCSFAQAVFNGISVLCVIGLLTTPYAIKEGGWLNLIILLIFGVLSCYTEILLKRSLESSPELQTYPDIGQAAFGLTGRLGIAIILYIELYASCVEYILIMSDNLASLFPDIHINFAGTHLGSHQVFAITATFFVLPTVWLRNMRGRIVASILVTLCLFWVGMVDGVGFHPRGTALDLANLSVTIGIFGFSYSSHAVFPNIYSSMKEPSKFSSVFIASFVFCFLIYTMVAICGFRMFGDSFKSQFTLDMPREFVASNIAIWTVVVNPLSKYALTLTPIAMSVEELLPSAQLRSNSIVIIIRTVLVLSTLLVALTVPFFGE